MTSTGAADPVTGLYNAPFRLEANPTLSPVQQAIEQDLAGIVRDRPAADELYRSIPETWNGAIINADSYRELSYWFSQGRLPMHLIPVMEREVPEFSAVAQESAQARRMVRTHLTSATTNPASAASKDRILRSIRSGSKPGSSPFILVLNGGSGSGKTRFITANRHILPAGTVAFDSTLTSLGFAERLIAESRDHGQGVIVTFIATDFQLAMERMIGRACTDGRYISATGMANNHAQSRATMAALVSKYIHHRDLRLSMYRSDSARHVLQAVDSLLVEPYPAIEELAHDAHRIIERHTLAIPADLLRRIIR